MHQSIPGHEHTFQGPNDGHVTLELLGTFVTARADAVRSSLSHVIGRLAPSRVGCSEHFGRALGIDDELSSCRRGPAEEHQEVKRSAAYKDGNTGPNLKGN